MTRGVSSAFYSRLQEDNVEITELVELELPNGSIYYWTTADGEITYTLSGTARRYKPFPGGTPTGISESSDLSVAVIDFVMANTGTDIQAMLASGDFPQAILKVGRVFIDTPDLGRMDIYRGKIGDFVYDRQNLKGQARNRWNSLNVRWPYETYEDTCVWRFGSTGCGFNTSSITLAINSILVGSSTSLNIRLPDGTLSNSYANDRFVFGRATITGGVNSGHVRTIRTHSGDLLGFSHPLPVNSLDGLTLSIFPGCRKKLIADCKSLYNNDKNFLGFPWLPVQEDAY